MTFKELKLSKEILRALGDLEHTNPTPIQELAISKIIMEKDLLASAQTGTGKTGAFVLPIIEKLLKEKTNHKKAKVLIISPTRELAIQIRDNFRDYSKYTYLKCGIIVGGMNQQNQIKSLKRGVDVIVATPGRLLDFMDRRLIKPDAINTLVLDEADTMLDMGFIHDVRKIIKHLPSQRQTLMFSATVPTKIKSLAKEFLNNYETIKTNNSEQMIDKIDQKIYFVDNKKKTDLLIDLFKNKEEQTLIFTRTKHAADKLSVRLLKAGFDNEVIHGDKQQRTRVKALAKFKEQRVNILIATDVAARGIDIANLPKVINYELPNQAEAYIHRIGRTGRAGAKGHAISLCDHSERNYLRDIENLIKQKIEVVTDHKYPATTKAKEHSNHKGHKDKRRHNNFQNKDNKHHQKKKSYGQNKQNNSKKYYQRNKDKKQSR